MASFISLGPASQWRKLPAALFMIGILSTGRFGVASSSDEVKPSLAELLSLYKELGLPLAPGDAPLVRLEVGGGGTLNGVPYKNKDGLGFLIDPGSKTEPPTLLRGAYAHQLDPIVRPKWTIVQPTAKVADETDSGYDGLLLAIQCHARGWDELAAKLLASSQDHVAPRNRLFESAWSYWESQLTEARSDRKQIAKHLKELIGRAKELDTQYHQELVKSLELTLIPGKGKPGSIEAMIDDLVDCGADSGRVVGSEREKHHHQLALLGFEAVPALIEHLDDDRLTRGTMHGFHNFHSFNLRVKHIVSDILEGLAGQGVAFNWLHRQQGYTVPKDGIADWWRNAQKEGEEGFLVKHFLDADEPSDGGRGARIRAHRLSVLVAKYPKRIPELYQTILEKHLNIETYGISQAMLAGEMPDAGKIKGYLRVLESKDLNLHPPALYALSKLSSAQFAKALIQSIEMFPADTEEPYYWMSPLGRIAEMALQCDDPQVWQVLAKVARRTKPGLRMEILYRATRRGDEIDMSLHRKELLAMLAEFLDDSDLSDSTTDRKIQMPMANYSYVKIEIRNAVTTGMGKILNVDVGPDTNRKPEEWAVLRARIREAWKNQQLPALNVARGGDPPVSPEVTAALKPYLDSYKLAGAICVIADRDGKVRYRNLLGYTDVEAKKPIDMDNVFWIASMTKMFAGASVMMLVDEGKLSLDDPVIKYIPQLRKLMVVEEKDEFHILLKPPSHPVTIRHLLSHTSGLTGSSELQQLTGSDRTPLQARALSSVTGPLQWQPGEKYQYGNQGMNVAARVVEIVSGMPYEEFLKKRIFDPAGMTETTFWPTEEQIARLAGAYGPNKEKNSFARRGIDFLTKPFSDRTHRYPEAGGGLFSTAHDILRYGLLLANDGALDGRRYLSHAAVEELQHVQTGKTKVNYSLGYHLRNGMFGHDGAYGTDLSVDPKTGMVAVFMVQCTGGDQWAARDLFLETAAKVFPK